MIVVGIIGILASVALPKYADMVRKSKEARTKGNLGGIRSAISIYYSDNDGNYPEQLEILALARKYIHEIPPSWTYEYGEVRTITNGH